MHRVCSSHCGGVSILPREELVAWGGLGTERPAFRNCCVSRFSWHTYSCFAAPHEHRLPQASCRSRWLHAALCCRYAGAKIEGVKKPPSLVTAYFDTLIKAGLKHRPTYETFYLVAHFRAPVWELFLPRVLWQVAKQALRQAWPQLATTWLLK